MWSEIGDVLEFTTNVLYKCIHSKRTQLCCKNIRFSCSRLHEIVFFCRLWQYGLWSFQTGDTKLERFLPKNQHTQRKLLHFEFWINGELSKIGHHFSNKKNEKDSNDF